MMGAGWLGEAATLGNGLSQASTRNRPNLKGMSFRMMRFVRTIARSLPALVALLVLASAPGVTAAETCTADGVAQAVDAAGSDLRAFGAQAQPKLKADLEALRDKKGWETEGFEERGLEYLFDGRVGEWDQQAGDLLGKIDTLGRPDSGRTDYCAAIAEIKAASSELTAVMRAKSAYLHDKIDRELGRTSTQPVAEAAPAATPLPAPLPQPQAKAEPPKPVDAPKAQTETATPEPKKPATPLPAETPAAVPQKPASVPSWSTTTKETLAKADPAPPSASGPPGEPYAPAPAAEGAFAIQQDGYTIDEIRDATRGFFGTVSTSLASVIEYAFKQSGRPSAYILGKEGGGALLAGVRYGKGTMYLRSGGTQEVYWHGPSIGYDFGAEGSRTLFLVYGLPEPTGLFRRFTGVDGSAYFVGGVGVTFLKGGDVLMAPIRSGLGLRLGANLGYLRFTPSPTWNPF